MNETKKTLIFGGVAVMLALLAFVTAPKRVTPDAFLDKGELFFPDFRDPNVATTLEVIDYDQNTGAARPFKVTFENGRWTIPSHHDYPADGKDRLANTAAGVIELRKDDFRSDNVADQEACGVIDPLDKTATSLQGRGQRVTIKGSNDQVLADIILGNKIPDRDKYRFVRIPGQKRIYAAKVDFDISTKFSDWIEKDLLTVNKPDIKEVILKDYSIDETTARVDQRDVVTLKKEGSDWKANRMSANQEVDKTKMNNLLTSLDELSIVGVRPKPEGLSQSLTKAGNGIRITKPDMLSLQNKGYYFSRDGQLLSNEGELQARTNDGVIYTLRFGEIAYGTGDVLTAGADSDENVGKGPGENRYLFITTEFDPEQFKEPQKPANSDFQNKPDSLWTDADRANKQLQNEYDKWKEKVEKGRKLSDDLNARFANWYYVISNDSFKKIHLTRKDLLKKKKNDT